MSRSTPVFINLLAIARYDHMPDYPIQFMTVGNLFYSDPDDVMLQYVESQQDEETGEIMKADISLSLRNGRITMERKANVLYLSAGLFLCNPLLDTQLFQLVPCFYI